MTHVNIQGNWTLPPVVEFNNAASKVRSHNLTLSKLVSVLQKCTNDNPGNGTQPELSETVAKVLETVNRGAKELSRLHRLYLSQPPPILGREKEVGKLTLEFCSIVRKCAISIDVIAKFEGPSETEDDQSRLIEDPNPTNEDPGSRTASPAKLEQCTQSLLRTEANLLRIWADIVGINGVNRQLDTAIIAPVHQRPNSSETPQGSNANRQSRFPLPVSPNPTIVPAYQHVHTPSPSDDDFQCAKTIVGLLIFAISVFLFYFFLKR